MNAGRINLVHVVLEMGIGGLQRLITDMSLAMDRDKFNIEVICLDELGCFAEVLQGHGIPVTLLRRRDRHLALYPFRLARLFRKRNVHIAHMHPGTLIFGVLAAQISGRPVTVYTEHGRGVPEMPMRLVEDRVSGVLMDQVIAVSRELEVYMAEVVKIPARKICTVINGICTDEFIPRPKSTELLAEFNISPQSPVLGTVARIDKVKDQITMIKAAKIVRQSFPNARLLIVGDGTDRQEVESFIDEQGLRESVTITGQRNDVTAMLNLFDIFLLSSLREGTSISLLEAMSSGVAPIVTNVGGNPAIVADGVDGLLVEPKNPEQLAAAISGLLRDAERRRLYAGRAVTKVREHFSIAAMTRQYVEIYARHLGKRRKFRRLVE